MEMQIPCLPISERTTWIDLPDRFMEFLEAVEEQTGLCPPMMIFEPQPDPRVPGHRATVSEAPEELVVVAVGSEVRAACFQALERVAEREPKLPPDHPVKSLKVKGNTPLKSFFRQMTEIPATVISLTLSADDPDAPTVFFLRTPFTVSEFRREMNTPLE